MFRLCLFSLCPTQFFIFRNFPFFFSIFHHTHAFLFKINTTPPWRNHLLCCPFRKTQSRLFGSQCELNFCFSVVRTLKIFSNFILLIPLKDSEHNILKCHFTGYYHKQHYSWSMWSYMYIHKLYGERRLDIRYVLMTSYVFTDTYLPV